MSILTIDLVFADLSDKDLSAVYDQHETIKKGVEKIVKKLPLGRFLTEIDVY